ncbi:pyrimidine-nucleoside phosphorylase [Marininema mesophilum]|uniref:Pyrimidine-nucleoside phosphorylase n=1 Tax=Marininema mesophilum TaxID=1048340 RepID=A0A1H2UHS6_9BACL|nr:pyrimidine-nucleoside phosphorylase [Marininema mesophilum]SDW55660.1 pyrimidine-nucleoside phosphorylase [Marininema mesophilum]
MQTVELIRKKRDGKELSTEEIRHLVQGYSEGKIPDYQMSAWAMAVFFQGMTSRERADLTMEMVHSGDVVKLDSIQGVKVDKHSTGGVGDTTTLVLGPLVAAAGVPVAKLSGRGLGHTGGTIDKLESFAGFSTSLTTDAFVNQVNQLGIAVMGQTADLTPADKQLYGLRDVTATVDSIPLIASSIMSKKVAAGADGIVLDVKTGKGAFMKDEEHAINLAQAMVEIGSNLGRTTVAIISDMEQPLGFAVGNALEVKEAIDTLKGVGPEDLTEICLTLGAHMVVIGGKADSAEGARRILEEKIADGSALAKFREFVEAQGGDQRAIDDPSHLTQADHLIEVTAPSSGTVATLEAEEIGICAMMLGAGRETKDDEIDYAVGIVLKKKVGDRVEEGEVLAVLHANDQSKVGEVQARFLQAVTISDKLAVAPRLIKALVTEQGVETL